MKLCFTLEVFVVILATSGVCCISTSCELASEATGHVFASNSSVIPINGNSSQAKCSLQGRQLINSLNWFEPMENATNSVLLPLIGYLLQRTTRRQFIIFHDNSFPETAGIVMMAQETMVDSIVLEYDTNLKPLEATLRSNLYAARTRNVLLLCSTENTAAIFETVRNLTMESPLVRWLVIANENITVSLAAVLREGTQVVVATRISSRFYQIFSSYVNMEDKVRFKHIEDWEVTESTPEIPQSQRKDPTTTLRKNQVNRRGQEGYLFPDLDSVYDDFQGRRLTTAAVSNDPFFVLNVLEDGTVTPSSGIDYEILSALGYRLNFTFGVVRPKDGRWGGPESDGSVSGMIGMVARYEVHFAIDEITVTASRETVVDFTSPYFLEGTVLVSRAPTRKDPTLAVVQPFTPLVWMLLVITTLIVGPIGYIITKLHHYLVSTKDSNSKIIRLRDDPRSPSDNLNYSSGHYVDRSSLSYYSFNMFRILVVQGNRATSDHTPIRIVVSFWYIFCIVIYSLYAGTLTAFMTIPAFENPIDSPEDLIKAYKEGFAPAVQPGTSNEYFLKSAKSGIFNELWNLMDPSRSFPGSGSVAMEKVLTDDIVYMTADLNSRIRTSQKGSRRFHLSKEKFVLQGLGIACRSGAPFLQKFNEILLKINQGGLIDKWIKDALRKLAEASGSGGQGDTRESLALTLNHLQAAFFILFGGAMLAGITLFAEIMIATWFPKDGDYR